MEIIIINETNEIRERQISYMTHVESKKIMQMKLSTKRKQTHKLMVTKGE